MDFEWANKTLDTLLAAGLIPALDSYESWTNWIQAHSENGWITNYLNDFDLYFAEGEEKTCFYHPDHDCVIKFDQDNNRFNRCGIEAFLYSRAVEAGLEKFFAASSLLREVDGVSFYIQEYAEVDPDAIDNSLIQWVAQDYDPNDFENDEVYEARMFEEASELSEEDRIFGILGYTTETRRLVDFIDRYEINDLHNHNWGVTENGDIVMIDYSGFLCDETYERVFKDENCASQI